MATYKQLPAVMNLVVRSGDEASTLVDFDTALTGYTVTSSLHSLVTREKMYDIDTTVSNASSGQVLVKFTEENTSLVGSFSWKMAWTEPGSVSRTVMSGIVEFVGQ